MADGQHVLEYFPCQPKDFNTGRIRLPTEVIKRTGARINQPVKIRHGCGYVFCTVWPITVDNCGAGAFQVDSFVTLYSKPTEVSNTENIYCGQMYLRIPRDIRVICPDKATEISVSVVLSSKGNFEQSLSDSQQQERTEKNVGSMLLGHCLTPGCSIAPKRFRNNFRTLQQDIEKISVNSVEPSSVCSETEENNIVIVTKRTKVHITSLKMSSERCENTQFVIGGLDDAAKMLYEIVKFPFLYPESFSHLGLECPKGVLLQGAPGVGKTLLVRAVASKCNTPLLTLNGTDIFGPHSGESEENLRKAFEKARIASKCGPCILFIDEIDALCPKRGSSGNEEENRIVAQLLTLMDGLDTRGSLIVIGATNRPNAIDPALRRPGRFDREVVIGVPTAVQRLAILKAHTKTLPLASDVDLVQLAEITLGYVGADLASLCREATLTALRKALHMETDKMGPSESRGRSICMSDFQLSMCHIVPSMYRGMQEVVDLHPVDWSSIGGLHDVKLALQQAVEWPFKFPEAFARMGLKRPQGVLLYGPPGCCKTTLVRAAATACHCTFLSLSCAQLYSPYVGDAERTIREVFTKARATAPSILFLDELDSIAGRRSDKATGSGVEARILATLLNEMDGVGISANIYASGEKEQTSTDSDKKNTTGKQKLIHDFEMTVSSVDAKNELEKKQPKIPVVHLQDHETLQKRNGSPISKPNISNKHESEVSFEVKELSELTNFKREDLLPETSDKERLDGQSVRDVLVVAATNRPDSIDGALLRPGRMDRMLYVPPPDVEARLEILKVHTRASPLGKDVDIDGTAVETELYSGADLENLCREAALYSLQEKGMTADTIDDRHFTQALATVRPSLTQAQLDSYKRWTK